MARVDSIPGWLRSEDAEKLYELAQLTPGPILEVGTHLGKSAVVMALALQDEQRRDVILYTLDVDRRAIRTAAAEAKARDLQDVIVFVHGTLRAFAKAYPQLRPTLTFLDGDHSRAGVERDLQVLEMLVPAGGLLVFHDFADPRNDDPDHPETKVRPAVEASWVARQCEFEGTFGVCGLFVRRDVPPRSTPALAELVALDSGRDQLRYRVRYPAAQLLRHVVARPKR